MKVKIRRCFMLLMMAAGMLLSAGTASAYQGETAGQAGEPPVMEEITLTGNASGTAETVVTDNTTVGAADTADAGEQADAGRMPAEGEDAAETAARENQAVGTTQESGTGETPFSIPGNGLLLDDKSEDGTKQFLTIRTKNGNTFFMVLDRSNNTENVYMLSMIDENDLAEFIGDAKDKSNTEMPSLVIPQKEIATEIPVQEQESGKDDTKQEKSEAGGMNTGAVFVLLVFLIGGAGGLYYFKVVKPKRDEEDAEVEDLEFCDDGVYINEDQEDSGEDDGDSEDYDE